MDENKPRRRWLSFGIRDLLWAMVVMGLVLAWTAERRRANGLAGFNEFLLEAIDNSGYRADGNFFGPMLMPKRE